MWIFMVRLETYVDLVKHSIIGIKYFYLIFVFYIFIKLHRKQNENLDDLPYDRTTVAVYMIRKGFANDRNKPS